MAEISAKDVMNLRNSTGLPMMACKQALQEAEGDLAAAEDLLRKQLKGKMEKRVDRAAGEGRVAVAVNDDGSAGAIVELRAETDFTAKNDAFTEAAAKIADLALNAQPGPVSPTDEMTAQIDGVRMTTGENCSIARIHRLGGGGTRIGSYVHHDGKTGVLIEAEGNATPETLRQVCMHVTAAVPRPMGVTAEDIPADVVEKERKFRIDQAVESGKPQEIAEKIVEGGMKKFFSEVALLEQPFVMDPEKKISDVLAGATIKTFLRWEVGEEAGE